MSNDNKLNDAMDSEAPVTPARRQPDPPPRRQQPTQPMSTAGQEADALLAALRTPAAAPADAPHPSSFEGVSADDAPPLGALLAAQRRKNIINMVIVFAVAVLVLAAAVLLPLAMTSGKPASTLADEPAAPTVAEPAKAVTAAPVAAPVKVKRPVKINLSGCDPLSLEAVPGTNGREVAAPDSCIKYEYAD